MWNLRTDQQTFLRATQDEIHRKVMGMKPKKGESQGEYWIICYGRLKALREELKIEAWSDRWARLVFHGAGRTQEGGPEGTTSTLVAEVLAWRGWDFLRQQEAAHNGSQGHGKMIRPWRWETALGRFANREKKNGSNRWQAWMTSRREWLRRADNFVKWRRDVRC